jgi:hypothetical protein
MIETIVFSFLFFLFNSYSHADRSLWQLIETIILAGIFLFNSLIVLAGIKCQDDAQYIYIYKLALYS